MVKLDPLEAFLAMDFDLLPVMPACVDTLGVLTNDERDLSFRLAGTVTGVITSGALTFILL